MHRHGYIGKKFGRERDQRRALLKSLAESLIRDEAIETTEVKAKELVRYMEKLITKAKKSNLHSRRQIIASLQTIESANKLMDAIAPLLSNRNSGHLRVIRTVLRRGDNAQLAQVSFVDDLKATKKTETSKSTTQERKVKTPVKAKAVTNKTKTPTGVKS